MSAMRQSDRFVGNLSELYSSDLKDKLTERHTVDSLDRVKELQNSSTSGLCKITDKKSILQNILIHRARILESVEAIDLAFSINLRESLEKVLPATPNMIKSGKNVDLANMINNLFDPFEVLAAKLKEQQEIDAAMSVRTRRGATEATSSMPYQIANELVELKTNLDKQIIKNKVGAIMDLIKPVKLTPTQRARVFNLARHLMLDEAYRKCPFCGHEGTNSVPENDTVEGDNERDRLLYNRVLKLWTDFVKAMEEATKNNTTKPKNPTHPVTKKTMKGPPKQPKGRALILMCMCQNATCIQVGSDMGSTCFIKCNDKNTGRRYPAVGPSKRCQCPVCRCQCPGAWEMQDHNKIALKLIQLCNEGYFEEDRESPEQGLQSFLRTAAVGGVLAAQGVMNNPDNVPRNRDTVQMAGQLICEGMAGAIVRNASDMPASTRQLLAGQFGTSTTVNLPSGDQLDTRSLSRLVIEYFVFL